ncbi:MAG: DUF2071 domain-containing protein, partial [Verrucomicrobiota bacterium]
NKDRLLIGQVHHRPYPLHEVELDAHEMTALHQAGFQIGAVPPVHAIFSPGVDVEVFAVEKVD